MKQLLMLTLVFAGLSFTELSAQSCCPTLLPNCCVPACCSSDNAKADKTAKVTTCTPEQMAACTPEQRKACVGAGKTATTTSSVRTSAAATGKSSSNTPSNRLVATRLKNL